MGLAVALLFFAAVEGVLFLVGVTPLSRRADPYVGFAGYAPLFVEGTGPDGSPVLRTSDAKANWFNPQRFAAQKAEGTTRIFCLGGSTTYGRPYEDATSFCGWLREFLAEAEPDRQWEVVNAGGISYASYRVVRLMEELARYEPDLFVIYTGHNEFLERRTYGRLLNTPEFVRDLGSLASGLRLYSAMSDVLYPEEDVLDAELDVVLDQSVGPEDYRRDDALRDAVLEHFRSSVGRMVRTGRDAGAEVLLVTPASNVRDFSPFKAEPSPGLDAARATEAARSGEAVADLLESGDDARAAALAEEALAVDPRNADLLFLRGRALLRLGETEGARRALLAARDEDVAPLRAPSPVPRVVAEVAAAEATGFVDFEAMMQEASAEGIPGDDHFLDHVHPTIDAHRLLALAILDELVEMGVASPESSWNDAVAADVGARVLAGIDEAAHARALANLARILSWAGKQEEALTAAGRATEMARDPHTVFEMLNVLVREGRRDEALLHAAEAARLMPDIPDVRRMNGVLLSESGASAEALPELQAAVRLDPTSAVNQYHLALVLSDLGRRGEAEAAYRRAVDLDPLHADALNNLGILLAQRGDTRGALELFERAVGANPSHPNAAQNAARARRMLGG